MNNNLNGLLGEFLKLLNNKIYEQHLATDTYTYRCGLYDAKKIIENHILDMKLKWDGDAHFANILFGESYDKDWSYNNVNQSNTKTKHMNTPLMELIEWVDKKLTLSDGGMTADVAYIKEKATELLEKERATIEQAYEIGDHDGQLTDDFYSSRFAFTKSDYYTKTFTNESK